MSLVLDRGPGESFVVIDAHDPESFTLVTIHDRRKVEIDAPSNIHVIRREILHRYAVHANVLSALERMEAARNEKQTSR